MNLRCTYCQVPFTLSRNDMLMALQKMDAENLRHHDAHCPNCRRANSVARQRLEMVFPNWKHALEEALKAPAPAAPVPAPAKPAVATPEPKAKPTAKKPVAEKKPAAKEKPAVKKPVAKAKPAAKPKATPAPKAKKK